MRLDAHQHFWDLKNPFTRWPTADHGVIYRDFGPEDLAQHLAANGIDQTILVQAAPNIAETHWCLELANRHAFIAGVVGWIDFEAGDAIDQLDSVADHPKLVGLRPMVQSIAQPGWLLQHAFSPIFRRMAERKLCFDGLVLHHQVGDLVDLAALHPRLPIVLDHAGKPPICDGNVIGWAESVARLAAHDNVFCKLSGLWTEAGPDHSISRVRPWVAHVLKCFGPSRLIWGSDWPVLTAAGSYRDWLQQCQAMLSHLTDKQIAGIMGENGKRFYGI